MYLIASIIAFIAFAFLIFRKVANHFTAEPEENRTLFSVDPDLYIEKRIFFQVLEKNGRAGGKRHKAVKQEIEEMEAKTVSDLELSYLRNEADQALSEMPIQKSEYTFSHS